MTYLISVPMAAAHGALNSFDGDVELDKRGGAHAWSYSGEREAVPLKVTPQGHIEGLWWEALECVYVIVFCGEESLRRAPSLSSSLTIRLDRWVRR